MEKITLQDLPSEMIHHISSFLRRRDVKSYLLSSSNIYKAITCGKPDKRTPLEEYRISHLQEQILNDLEKCENEFILFKAPPSIGKTLITLLFLLRKDGTHLIVVPPSVVDSWIFEVTKFFPLLYSEKEPGKSAILVFDAKNKKHRKFFSSTASFDSVRIVIIGSSLYGEMKKSIPINFIWKAYDEPNLKEICENTVRFSRTILISASDILLYRSVQQQIQRETPIYEIKISFSVIKEHIPSIKEIYTTDSLDSILSLIFKKNSHAIIFFGKEKDYVSPTIDCNIFSHKSDMNILERFYRSNGRTVLLTTYGKLGTGHNLKGSSVIFYQCSGMEYTILLRAQSRFLRITSECPEVTFYFSCSTEEDLWKMRSLMAYARVEKEYDIDFLLFSDTSKYISRLCKSYSVDVDRLSSLEILYYYCLSSESGLPLGILPEARNKIMDLCQKNGIEDPNLEKFKAKGE